MDERPDLDLSGGDGPDQGPGRDHEQLSAREALDRALAIRLRGSRFSRWLLSSYWRLFKYTMLFFAVAALGLVLATRVAIPEISERMSSSGVRVVEDPTGGTDRIMYEESKVPKTYEQELDAPRSTLIYENQVRSTEHEHDVEGGEGDASVPADAQRELRKAAYAFLERWETFSADDTAEVYRNRLLDVADPAFVDELAERVDAKGPEAVRPGGSAGSRLAPGEGFDVRDAGQCMVHRYDQQTAYMTCRASVLYTGPSLIWRDAKVIRSYGLVLNREGTEWRVARSAVQSLTRIKE